MCAGARRRPLRPPRVGLSIELADNMLNKSLIQINFGLLSYLCWGRSPPPWRRRDWRQGGAGPRRATGMEADGKAWYEFLQGLA